MIQPMRQMLFRQAKQVRFFSRGEAKRDILYGSDFGLRTVAFDRPKALNALTLGMVRELTPKLHSFEQNQTVGAVVFQGKKDEETNKSKSFCAGGDIRYLYDNGQKEETRYLATDFFREEYRLNYLLGTMETPVVSILNGITMGGGCGLSLHGKFVVATENTTLAMPETAIGFFPDVGASYILPRLGRRLMEKEIYVSDASPAAALVGQGLGTYLALTGERIRGAEVAALGLSTHFIKNEDLDMVEESLAGIRFKPQMDQETKDAMVEEALTDLECEEVDREPSPEFLQTVEDIFGATHDDDTVEGIFQRLYNHNSEWSLKIHKNLLRMSPISLKVTLEQMRRGAMLSLEDCFTMEYRIACRMMENPEFFEGVRSVIVDKDNKPNWTHESVSKVTKEEVHKFFEPLGESDLVLYDME